MRRGRPARAQSTRASSTSSPSACTDHTAETLFEGILQLPPGSFMTVGHGTARPGADAVVRARTRPTSAAPRPVDALRERMTDAVALRLRSDVPVGTTLSGGLDSSTVTALATMLRREDGLGPAPTFSSRCDDPQIDEWPYIEPCSSDRSGQRGLLSRTRTTCSPNLDHVLWHMDEPFHCGSVYGHWKLSGARALERRHRAPRRPGRRRGALRATSTSSTRASSTPSCAGALSGVRSARRALRTPRPGRTAAALVQGHAEGVPARRASRAATSAGVAPCRRRCRRCPDRSLAAHHLYGLGTHPLPMYNHHLDRNDDGARARGPQPVPRLSRRRVRARASSPTTTCCDGYTKWTLREAMRHLLPEEVVDRGRKQGFTTDESHWMRGRLGELMEEAFSSESSRRARPYFDQAALLRPARGAPRRREPRRRALAGVHRRALAPALRRPGDARLSGRCRSSAR